MKDKLARGALWVVSARVLVGMIGFASTLLLARLLVPADFGLVAIAMTVVAIAGSITELSLASALVQHDSPDAAHYDTAFTLNAMRSAALAILLAGLSIPISEIYGDARLIAILIVIAGGVFVSGLQNPKLVVYTRNLVFWQDFVLNVSSKLTGFAVGLVIAWFYKSYWALVISAVAVQIQSVLVSYLMVRYRPRIQLSQWRELIGFSVWVSFAQAVNTLNWRSDSMVIGYVLGNQPLGYYSFGDNLASMPTREATAPVAQTLFPAFSRLSDDLARLRSAYQRSQALLCVIAFPIGVGFALLAEPLVILTVGVKWLPAVVVIQALSGVFALQALASSAQPLAMAMGQTKSLFEISAINITVRMPLIVTGILYAGLLGAVYARVMSGIIGIIVNMLLVRKLIGLSLFDQFWVNFRALCATAVMAICFLCVPQIVALNREAGNLFEVCNLVVIGASLYVVILYGLWIVMGRPGGPEAEFVLLARRIHSAIIDRIAPIRRL